MSKIIPPQRESSCWKKKGKNSLINDIQYECHRLDPTR